MTARVSAPATAAMAAACRVALTGVVLFGVALLAPAFARAPIQSGPPQKTSTTQPGKNEPKADPLAPLIKTINDALAQYDYATALPALQRYIEQRPEDASGHFQLAYTFSGLGRADDAKTEYKKAIELNPKLAAAYVNLGLLLLDKDPAAAAPQFRQAAELMPDRARPRVLLGQALERNKDANGALAEYEAAVKIEPQDFEARFALGRILLQLNRAADAEAGFREALKVQPDAPRAQLGLAESLLAQKKYEPSAAAFESYLKAQPDDKASRREAAGVLIELERYDEAEAQLDRIDVGRPASIETTELRAEIYMRQKLWASAQGVLQKATQQFPASAEFHAWLGRVLLAEAQYSAAEQELRRALQLDANWLDARRDMVAVYYKGGSFSAALAAIDDLQKYDPLPPGSWFIRATCYDKLGKKPEAIAAYQKFLDSGDKSNSDEVWQAQQRIRALTHELQRKR